MGFFKGFIEELIQQGHTVDIASCESDKSKLPACYREWGCVVYQISTSRSPVNKGNLRAIKQIGKIVQKNNYDIVHCHTPIAAFCTRLACRTLRKKGLKVIYTAHGFHFYKGAPLKNWMIYYPLEKYCSKFTDLLITINQEDYMFAQKKMKADCIAYVPGVGIDLQKFSVSSVSADEKRAELGIPDGAFLMLSVGELNRNKNHEVVLRAMSLLSDPNIHYAIAGAGDLREYLLSLSEELGIRDHVHLLGYRKDVAELYRAADVFVFPSFREGLSVSLMEAMASGLPCLVSDIRGNRDLIVSERCPPGNAAAFAGNIRRIKEDGKLRSHMQSIVTETIKSFEISAINEEIHRLYQQMLDRAKKTDKL